MEQVEEIRHTIGMKERYKQRKETIERVFADTKEKHGMRYTQYRGCLLYTSRIYDAFGNEQGLIEEKVLSFMPKFRMYVNGELTGEIRKELTLFRPRFNLDCNGWQVNGDIFEWNYAVTDSWQNIICSVSKQVLRLTDTYEIDVANPADALYCLMIVLAIDAAKCSNGD